MASAAILINGVLGSREDLTIGVAATLTNNDNTGALTWAWTFVSIPPGSAATITNPTSATATFTPDVVGSYLINLVVSDGLLSYSDRKVGAVRTTNLSIRIPAVEEEDAFDTTNGWGGAMYTAFTNIDAQIWTKLQGRDVSSALPDDGYGLVWNNGGSTWESGKPVPGGTAGGDLSGTYPNPTVDGLQGRSVASTAPTDGYALVWNNALSRWEPGVVATGGNTLDQSYDEGGAGAGRSITADAGAVDIDGNGAEVLSLDGYVGLRTISAPTQLANKGLLYVASDSADAELFYKDKSGRATQITIDGTVSSSNAVINVNRFTGSAASKLNQAIQTLPAIFGGIIDATSLTGAQTIDATVVVDRPIVLYLGSGTLASTVTTAFDVRYSFRVFGTNRESSMILATLNNTILFDLKSYVSADPGKPVFELRNCWLQSIATSGDIGIDVSQGNFVEGLIHVENCLITNFRDTAIKIGSIVNGCYFFHIEKNYFQANNISVYCGLNSDGIIKDNQFAQTSPVYDVEASVVLVGPDVQIIGNGFYGNAYDDSTDVPPDILILPLFDDVGGWSWISRNKFGSENETLNPYRSRIRVYNSSDGYAVSAPCFVKDNLFFGNTAGYTLASISRTTGITTVNLTGQHYIPIGSTAILTISGITQLSFNGTFTVTATTTTAFTYGQPSEPDLVGTLTGSSQVTDTNFVCIKLDNPIDRWTITDNIFYGIGKVIDDIQPYPTDPFRFGMSVFTNNRISPLTGRGCKLFTNGGRQFSKVEDPVFESKSYDSTIPNLDTGGNNLIAYSELLSSWTLSAGVTVAAFTDPYGTTRAWKIRADGSAGLQFATIPISISSQDKIFVSFSGKEGSVAGSSDGAEAGSCMVVGIWDNTDSYWTGQLETFTLGSDWKRYRFVSAIPNIGHTYQLKIGPAIYSSYGAMDGYIFAPQVSTNETSCYIPTTSSPVLTSSIQERFEKTFEVYNSSVDGYVSLLSTTSPTNIQNHGLLYVKNTFDGYSEYHNELYYKDNYGQESQITFDGYLSIQSHEEEFTTITGTETSMILTRQPKSALDRRSGYAMDVYRNGILMRYVSVLAGDTSTWTYTSSQKRVSWVAPGGAGNWYAVIFN